MVIIKPGNLSDSPGKISYKIKAKLNVSMIKDRKVYWVDMCTSEKKVYISFCYFCVCT